LPSIVCVCETPLIPLARGCEAPIVSGEGASNRPPRSQRLNCPIG
jgi:hypothetical protein